MKRIACVMMVRNEADILEVNIRHHFAQGVTRFLIVDNGSTDGSGEILDRLGVEIPMTVVYNDGDYLQAEITSQLANRAFLDGADWILPVDADEFWYAPGSTIAQQLEAARESVLRVELINFVQVREQDTPSRTALLSMTSRPPIQFGPVSRIRELVNTNRIGYVEAEYPRKCIAQASHELRFGIGNHHARGISGASVDTSAILCLHAPLRSKSTLRAKMYDHGQRSVDIGEKGQLWWQAHRWHRLLGEGGEPAVEAEWAANSARNGYLDVYGNRHQVVRDWRLRELVEPLVEDISEA